MLFEFYNPTKRQISGELHSFKKISEARYLNLNEEPLNDDKLKLTNNTVSLKVLPKKIITLELMSLI